MIRFDRVRRPLLPALSGACAFLAIASAAAQNSVRPTPATRPAATAAVDPFWIRITSDRVNLRSRPDRNSVPLSYLNQSDVLQVFAAEFGWYRVRPPAGTFSIVSAQHVETTGEDRGRVSVQSGKLRVRVGSTVQELDPNQSEVQTWLSNGAEVRILGRTGDWLKIAPPDDVFAYVNEEFTERVGDEDAKRLSAAAKLAVLPTATRPSANRGDAEQASAASADDSTHAPPTVPVDLSARWGRALSGAESRIESESAKPILDQNWSVAIDALRPIAAQSDEPLVAQLASAWITRLEGRIAQQERVRKAREIAGRESEGREGFERELEHIHRARAERSADKSFDARGLLQASVAFDAKRFPNRYRLADPVTRSLEAYVDFPANSKITPRDFLGKYVGIRGSRKRDPALGVDIIQLTEISIIDQSQTTTSAPAARP